MIQYGCNCRFPVCSRYTNEFQTFCRISIKRSSHLSDRIFRIRHTDKGDVGRHFSWNGFTNQDRRSAFFNRAGNKSVPIGLRAFDSHKEVAFFHQARVHIHAVNINRETPSRFEGTDFLQEVRQFHHVYILYALNDLLTPKAGFISFCPCSM